jgi:4-hydroxy-3-methylbut-2-enyl diphosphate reductase
MGQWLREDADAGPRGAIYLVEDVADAMALDVAQPDNVAYTTQTTLSVDETRDVIGALQQRFPALQGPRHDDICYATQNRQDAVRELAEKQGATAYLVDGAEFIDPAWLAGKRCVGVTAGASAPEVLVQGVIARLQQLGGGGVRELHGEPEDMVFALPKELRVVLVD